MDLLADPMARDIAIAGLSAFVTLAISHFSVRTQLEFIKGQLSLVVTLKSDVDKLESICENHELRILQIENDTYQSH